MAGRGRRAAGPPAARGAWGAPCGPEQVAGRRQWGLLATRAITLRVCLLASLQCLKIPYLGVRVRVRPFWRSGRVPGSGARSLGKFTKTSENMPRGLRFSTAVHRTFSNNFRTRKNPISQARKRPGSYPILPPPRAIPNPIPTTPKPDLPVKNGDPGLKTGYFFTLAAVAANLAVFVALTQSF